MEDDHVDRLGVEARRRVELTSTNRSIGLIALIIQCPSLIGWTNDRNTICFIVVLCRPGGLRRSDQTRSHPELGRQTLQRQWYYVSRPGRVGRRQACNAQQDLFFDRIQNSSFIGGACGGFRCVASLKISASLTRGGAAR